MNGTYEGEGKLKLHYRNDASDEYAIESSERYDDNEWHHVIAVKDYDSWEKSIYTLMLVGRSTRCKHGFY